MTYLFGHKGKIEILKTKSDEHTDLKGYQELSTTYADQIITDNFRVVKKIDSKDDVEGNKYDWYEIDHHFRNCDKFTPAKPDIDQSIFDLEELIVDMQYNEIIDGLEG